LADRLLVTLLTFSARSAASRWLELATSVNYLLRVPGAGLAPWLVMWRVKFSLLEDVAGLLGLALVVFGVARWQLHPDWSQFLHQAVVRGIRPGGPADVLLLRDRPVRRGHDPVRGVLLLLRRGRGTLDRQGH
jgi:hypothetical protein